MVFNLLLTLSCISLGASFVVIFCCQTLIIAVMAYEIPVVRLVSILVTSNLTRNLVHPICPYNFARSFCVALTISSISFLC